MLAAGFLIRRTSPCARRPQLLLRMLDAVSRLRACRRQRPRPTNGSSSSWWSSMAPPPPASSRRRLHLQACRRRPRTRDGRLHHKLVGGVPAPATDASTTLVGGVPAPATDAYTTLVGGVPAPGTDASTAPSSETSPHRGRTPPPRARRLTGGALRALGTGVCPPHVNAADARRR
jgi:hypothetical protein